MTYFETLDDIPFDQELEGSEDYETAFPDEDAEEIEAAVMQPALAMPELSEIRQSLEDLLAEAMKAQTKKGEIKGLRKAARRADLPREERDALLAKIRSWEDTYEWNTEALVAMFQEQSCSCGSDFRHFIGYFYQQPHKTQHEARRIVRTEESEVIDQATKNKFLPRRIMMRREKVTCCSICVINQGFDLSTIEILE